ncbi:MAG: pilus assembly protein PilO [Betaproteobacteria bacterium]|nr:MAG: pilus assembly protein PilO [Betaproteobacteria bacterium]
MNLIEEINQLNTKNPGSWPLVIKVGVLVILLMAIVTAGYFLDWQKQWESLDQAEAEEVKLKETYLVKKKDAVNLDVLRLQLKDIELSLGALLKQLPHKSEMDALLIDINHAGLGRGLQFELFKPAASEIISEFYAELPITLRVTGNYHDIGAFASDISQLPRIVTLNNISITPNTKTKEGLVMNATAKTFRYLDEEETEKQKGGSK